jgi:dienelactone hydrolase
MRREWLHPSPIRVVMTVAAPTRPEPFGPRSAVQSWRPRRTGRTETAMFEGMERIEFEHEGTLLRGYAARPAGTEPSPAVLVMHSALGIAHEVNERTARKLAEVGYVAVCTDMYGAHLENPSLEDSGRAFSENRADPEKQRARTVAWFDQVASLPDVDDQRIAAVGFCYGGMTVLELARSGANLKAAVSYHGVLTTHARAEPGVVRGHVVAYCGAGDPYAAREDVENLHQELRDAGVTDYQITVFGAAGHGFTDPDAAALHLDGVRYDALSNDVSWSGTLVLLDHVFGR